MPTIEIGNVAYNYDKIPDNCPLCRSGIQPLRIGSNIVERDRAVGDILQVLYRCPRDNCQSAFIGSYRQRSGYHSLFPEGEFVLRNTAPTVAKEPDTPAEIRQISPSYHEILYQSSRAEDFGLDQISGCGYRKALEFLIKDYAIHRNQEHADIIKTKLLGACINDHVADANVKSCAARAAWLGNDETHYVRKWTEKDIQDLKTLLRLTASWILNELLTEKYLLEMN